MNLQLFPYPGADGFKSDFVRSTTNGELAQVRDFKCYEQPTIRFKPVQQAPTGAYNARVAAFSATGYTAVAFLYTEAAGAAPRVLATTPVMDWNASGYFDGVLDLNTEEAIADTAALAAGTGLEVRFCFVLFNASGEPTIAEQPTRLFNAPPPADLPDPTAVTETIFANLLELSLADTAEVRWDRTDNTMEARAAVWRDATLSGPLRLECPASTPHGNTTALLTDETVVTVQGVTGRLYQLDLHVRGLNVVTTFSGGTAFGLMNIGGAHTHPTSNPWWIEVSDPPQIIFLNRADAAADRRAIDYLCSVTAKAGATITLAYDTQDHGLDNWSSEILVPGVNPYPAEFDGHFMQLDLEPQLARQTGRETLWIPAAAMTPRTTDGPTNATAETATNKVMQETLEFDPDTNQFAQFDVAMPKSWNRGAVTAEFHWQAGAGSGSARWGIQGLALSDGDAIEAAFGTAQKVTDALGTVDTLRISAETGAITIAGTPAVNDLVIFQVFREADHAADTLAELAQLKGVRLFYNTNAKNDA